MQKLIDDLKSALPAVFQGEDYQRRQAAIDESFQKRQGDAFSALRDKAAEKDIAILRTPLGFALAPTKNGEVVPPDEFGKWPEARRREVQTLIETLEKELEHIVRQIPRWETERRDEARQLGRDTAKYAVDQLIEDTKDAFKDIPRVVQHIETVRADLIENFGMFVIKARMTAARRAISEPAVHSIATKSMSSSLRTSTGRFQWSRSYILRLAT